jgi:EAL domain-containing protein (putative c-di-GMP-specific phosphodiesterase class I)
MDGDRFTVLLESIKAPSDPMRVAMRIQESLAAPLTANGVDAFTSASIGIALSAPSYASPGDMLRDADIAMCRAKAQGASGCEVFDAEMHALVVKRLKLETELRKAIELEELRVFYQPIVQLSTGKIAGVEALVRWWHNESEMVGPGEFIEVAEETGLIVPIGRWVMKEACRQAHAWHLLFNTDPLLTTTINVSPRQFAQSNLVADVKAALEETGVAPSSLQLEITETMAMSDPKTTNRTFSQLRNIEHDLESREIVHLIVTLAHHLNLKVIAEGIETSGQCSYLEQSGCEYGQGYLYSPPIDQEALRALLASARRESGEPVVTADPGLTPAV